MMDFVKTLTHGIRARTSRVRRAGDLKAHIEMVETPEDVRISESFPCTLRVRNTGGDTWRPDGENPVHVSYHWITPDGDVYIRDGLRSQLPRALKPGEECLVQCLVVPPNRTGKYFVEFDLVQESVTWFGTIGSPTLRQAYSVHRGPIGDIDYAAAWELADLDADYWTMVGPATKDEFDSLGKHKLKPLLELGITPSSRVLDVGCGTGCLTQVLLDSLGPDGLYYGTDLVEKPLDFCRKRYNRPNFHFLVNEPTRVPLEDLQFDYITLLSVFTHVYPNEIAEWLGSLKHLLAPGGKIVADIFVMQSEEDYWGNRGKMDIRESLLMEILDSTGFKHTVLGVATEGEGNVQRKLFCLEHADR